MSRLDRLLLGVGLAHAVVALVCVALMQVNATPILGVHPALKPFKFAASIAAFLITMSALVPILSTTETTRRVIATALSATMLLEMAIIAAQALRGRRSHFNYDAPFDAALTRTMILGIAVLLAAMVAVTILATTRPLASSTLVATAWRAALLIFLFGAISGIAMGGRGGHTVGGADGGPGMAVSNWSATHGDLRVSHFFALHALQILPALAAVVSWLPIVASTRWTVVILGIAVNAGLAGATFMQALSSRPFW